MDDSTEALLDWLRAIIQDVERRGVEEMSLNCFSGIGMYRTGERHTYKSAPTKDFFMSAMWRYKDAP